MKKQHVKWIIVISFLLIMIMLFIHPIIFKKNYIEKIIKLELPNTIKIIDYEFSFKLYGIDSFYAKIEINQDTYTSINKNIINDTNFIDYVQYEIISHHKHTSLNLKNADEIRVNQLLSSKNYFIFGSTTKEVYYIMVKENTGISYLYVFH